MAENWEPGGEFSQNSVSFMGPSAEFWSQGMAEAAGARGGGLPFLLGSGLSPPGTWNALGMGDPLPGAREPESVLLRGRRRNNNDGVQTSALHITPKNSGGRWLWGLPTGAFQRVKGNANGYSRPTVVSEACPPVGGTLLA